ncbi:MAG TPA: TetR family transcriptional regulator [Bryobacteraceae bacterium]|nr:TetR family transcriptional regulator [Bryobacteraceae bacterium]
MRSTRERILDAAERMFADHGYSATSVRSIIAKARVNVAAVHYHFRSKESLLEAVILRRAKPANEQRLALLDACERAAPGGHPPLREVIQAFLEPSIRVATDQTLGGEVFMRLLGRLHAEGDILPKILAMHFMPVLERFSRALRHALPDLPPEELYWRLHFAVGATTQALRGADSLEWLSGGLCHSSDPHQILERLVGFVSAGLGAPLTDRCTSGGLT